MRAGGPKTTSFLFFFFFSSRRRHTRSKRDWSSDVCSSDLFLTSAPPAPSGNRAARPYRFLYYARPNNVRNLFYRGLEAIHEAVAAGILDPQQWELCFVGKDIPRLRLANQVEPKRYQNLSWQAYAALVREIDLGLCLMYTPHPSYPPLDLAASGAVAVTNRFGNAKHSLDQYSKNIICPEPSVAGL